MSGTSYGTVILHVAPEAAVGGPLALLRTGDVIVVDVVGRTLNMLVDDGELAVRRADWTAPEVPSAARGYMKLFVEHVQGADLGADFDFLRGRQPPEVPRRGF